MHLSHTPDEVDVSGLTASDYAARIDSTPLKWLHVAIFLALGMGLFFDTVEASMTNVLATVFSQDDAVPRGELSMLLASVFVGGALGAPLGGWLADRIGRRLSLLFALGGYGLVSIAAGFMPSVAALTVARFLGGMFLATYPPLMWTYLSDVMPPKSRGKMMMLAGAIGGLGSVAAPIVTRTMDIWGLLGLEGWRWTLILGGVGGLIVALSMLPLPESPRWLFWKGRVSEAEKALAKFSHSSMLNCKNQSVADVETVAPHVDRAPGQVRAVKRDRGPFFIQRLFLLIGLQLCQPISVIGFVVLSGVVLGQKGFNVHDSLLYVGVAGIGAPLGAVIASTVIDRVSRPHLLLGASILLAVLGIAFALVDGPVAAMGIGAAFLFIGVIYTLAINIYGPELFITEYRGVTAGIGYAANRLGSALVPLALLPLLYAAGPIALFTLIAAVLLISGAFVMVVGPRDTAGQTLR